MIDVLLADSGNEACWYTRRAMQTVLTHNNLLRWSVARVELNQIFEQIFSAQVESLRLVHKYFLIFNDFLTFVD